MIIKNGLYSCIMDRSWLMHESSGKKLDSEGIKRLLCKKSLKL